MKHESVGVMVFTYQYDCFDLDVYYEDYKDLINKVKEECTLRYKRYCLLYIFLKDGALGRRRNRWVLVDGKDNRFPNEIVVET